MGTRSRRISRALLVVAVVAAQFVLPGLVPGAAAHPGVIVSSTSGGVAAATFERGTTVFARTGLGNPATSKGKGYKFIYRNPSNAIIRTSGCFNDPNSNGVTFNDSYTTVAGDGLGNWSVNVDEYANADCTGGVSVGTSATFALVDTTTPTVTVGATSPDPTNANTSFTWSASEPGTYTVRVGGSTCATGSAATGTNVSGSYTSGNVNTTVTNLATGANTVRVCVTDTATAPLTGNNTTTVTKDVAAPAVTITSAPSPALLGLANASTSLTWNATDANLTGGTYQLKLGGTSCANATNVSGAGNTNTSGSYTVSGSSVTSTILLGNLNEGLNTVRVCVTDAATNVGGAAGTATKDTTAPTASINSISVVADTAAVFFTTEVGATKVCKVDGGTYASCASPGAFGGLSDGSHMAFVSATDAAGNETEVSQDFTINSASNDETASGTGGSYNVVQIGDTATSVDPVESFLFAPTTGGTFSITESNTLTGTPPAGNGFFGQEVVVSGDSGTSSDPIIYGFRIDKASIPSAATTGEVQVFKNDTLVPPCSPKNGTATPDPCLYAKTTPSNGNLQITVLSATGGRFNFGLGKARAKILSANASGASGTAGSIPTYDSGTISVKLFKGPHLIEDFGAVAVDPDTAAWSVTTTASLTSGQGYTYKVQQVSSGTTVNVQKAFIAP